MQLILEVLNEIRPDKNFEYSKNFLEDGLLDSFDIVNIVAELEQRLDITIEGEDVTPENFTNIDSLQRLIHSYLEK